jgi:hypothetical protein
MSCPLGHWSQLQEIQLLTVLLGGTAMILTVGGCLLLLLFAIKLKMQLRCFEKAVSARPHPRQKRNQ